MSEANKVGIDITTSYEGKGVEQATRDQEKLTQTMNKVAAQTKQMASAQEAARGPMHNVTEEQRKLDDELAKFLSLSDRAYRAQRQLDTGNDLLHRSLKAGLITQQQHDEMLGRLASKYGQVAQGAQIAGREASTLFRALATGNVQQASSSVLQIGTRMAAVGVAGIAYAGGMAAAVAATVALAAESERVNRGLNQTEALFVSAGRGSEISRGQIAALTEEIARAGNMNKENAQITVNALSQARGVTTAFIVDLARLNSDFATATGQKPQEAARALGKAFEEPAKGARELDAQLNILSADQLIVIERLSAQGRTLEAQQALYEALKGRIQGLTSQAMTPLQRSINDVGNAWDRFVKWFLEPGNVVDIQNGVNRIARIISALTPGDPAARGTPGLGGDKKPRQPRGVTVPDQDPAAALQAQVKAALSVGDAYDNQGRRQRELTDTATRLRSAMSGLSDAGETNTESYKRLGAQLAGVNRELAEMGRRPTREIDTAIAARGRDLAKIEAQLAYLQQHGRLPEGTQETEARFETENPQGRLYRFPAKSKAQYVGQATRQDEAAQQIKLRTEALAEEQAVAQLAVDAEEALAQARVRESQALEQQWMQSIEYVKELEFQNSLMGVSSTEQRKLTELRRIDQMVETLSIGKSKEFREALEGVARTMREGVIAALDEHQRKLEDWQVGADTAVNAYGDSIRNVAGTSERFVRNTIRGFEDLLVGIRKGKFDVKAFGETFLDELIRIQIQLQIMRPLIGTADKPGALTSGLGALAKWLFGGKDTQPPAPVEDRPAPPPMPELLSFEMHSGGMVGTDGRPRYVDPRLFIGARRYHNGGTVLGPNEVPIIAERGERVSRGASGMNVRVTLINESSVQLQTEQRGQPQIDVEGVVVSIVVRDLAQGGPIRNTLQSMGRTA